MMEKIATNLDLSTYKRLQSLARPFVDTESTVIERLITFYEEHAGDEAVSGSFSKTPQPELEASNPPDLKHTKLLNGRFAGQAPGRTNWNELVRMAHIIALNKIGEIDQLKDLTLARIVAGYKDDEGYSYIADSGFSIQGVDANDAWRILFDLARKLDVALCADFKWREKEGAAFPGKKARLTWQPENSYLQDIQAGLDEWNSPDDAAAYDRL